MSQTRSQSTLKNHISAEPVLWCSLWVCGHRKCDFAKDLGSFHRKQIYSKTLIFLRLVWFQKTLSRAQASILFLRSFGRRAKFILFEKIMFLRVGYHWSFRSAPGRHQVNDMTCSNMYIGQVCPDADEFNILSRIKQKLSWIIWVLTLYNCDSAVKYFTRFRMPFAGDTVVYHSMIVCEEDSLSLARDEDRVM